MTAIHFFQVTAFGSPPYDGKTILLDDLVGAPLSRSTGTLARRKMENDGEESLSDKRAAILRKRAARLREPRILKRGEPVDMFDGKTLDGWFTSPRVYVPRNEKFASMPSDRLYDEVIRFYEENEGGGRIPNKERVKNRGVWEVKDGAVIGGQVPGSIAGSYLISEKTYGDFELTLEANPDFPYRYRHHGSRPQTGLGWISGSRRQSAKRFDWRGLRELRRIVPRLAVHDRRR